MKNELFTYLNDNYTQFMIFFSDIMELDEQDFDYDLDPSAFDPSGNSNFSCFENGTLEVPFEIPGANHTIENGTDVSAFLEI